MTESKTKVKPERPVRSSFMPSPQIEPTMALRTPIEQPANNMNGERLAPMTFNMPMPWHAEFKSTAAALGVERGHGVSMKDLLVECFDAWKREKARKG
jgi:hypothetical protein